MKRIRYDLKIKYIWRASLAFVAYVTVWPQCLPALLNKWRGVKILKPCKTYIAPNVVIDTLYPELVTIEEGVYVTRGVKILAHFNPTDGIAEIIGTDTVKKPVLIKKNAFLGVNCIILHGVTIGECALIAPGAVVAKDVPDYAIVVGNPGMVAGDVRQKSNW